MEERLIHLNLLQACAPRVLGYVLSRMRLAVKSKETGRYEPALICFWWIGPGKKRKLEKDDPMLVLATR